MPYDLQRIPVGLNDLLGAKSWARFQHEIEDRLTVTYQAREEYLWSKAEVLNGSVSVTGVGFFSAASTLVPPAESWYLMWAQVGMAAAVGVGDTLDIRPAIAVPQTAGGGSANITAPMGDRVTNGLWVASSWEPRIWLPPGSNPQLVFAKEKAGANFSVVHTAIFVRARN